MSGRDFIPDRPGRMYAQGTAPEDFEHDVRWSPAIVGQDLAIRMYCYTCKEGRCFYGEYVQADFVRAEFQHAGIPDSPPPSVP
jgi:hypothetical protein